MIGVGNLDKKPLSLQPFRELQQNNRYLDTKLHLIGEGNCLFLPPNLLSFTPLTVNPVRPVLPRVSVEGRSARPTTSQLQLLRGL